jgi:hypothetical protein
MLFIVDYNHEILSYAEVVTDDTQTQGYRYNIFFSLFSYF